MKRLRQLGAGLILTFALSASAFAGQVDCPGITDSQPTAAGETQNDLTTTILLLLALI